MGAFIEMSGKKFGRLAVVGRVGTDGIGNAQWECKCDCGSTHITNGVSLRHGRVVSCGCYQKEVAKALAITQPHPLIDRLLRYVTPDAENECWIWNGYKNEQGYGMIRYNGKQSFAHRMSYEIHTGPITKGRLLMHSCDNPSCVNPKHLSEGTSQDNSDDMHAKGRNRANPGESNGNSKLKADDVIQIRQMLAQGSSHSKTAAQFGVSKKLISNIQHRRAWGHI